MNSDQTPEKKRKRAPSQRALQTRERVLDAAESVFAARGYDGATIRDIAEAAQEPIGTVHHHGGGKEALFSQVIARRAEPLSKARLTALAHAKQRQPYDLHATLDAFIRPFFDLSKQDERWLNYARLVAHVSADTRWADIAQEHFDPAAQIFVTEFHHLLPETSMQRVLEGFIYSVSAMLALMTSEQRIRQLGGAPMEDSSIDHLIAFCAAGFANPS